jgi:hypothetical protein
MLTRSIALSFASMAPAGKKKPDADERALLLEPLRPGVVALLYPKQCRGDTFVETCGGVTRKMLAMNQPFSLLHDFRAVNYNLVDWNSNFQFFDAANEVTQKGGFKGYFASTLYL